MVQGAVYYSKNSKDHGAHLVERAVHFRKGNDEYFSVGFFADGTTEDILKLHSYWQSKRKDQKFLKELRKRSDDNGVRNLLIMVDEEASSVIRMLNYARKVFRDIAFGLKLPRCWNVIPSA